MSPHRCRTHGERLHAIKLAKVARTRKSRYDDKDQADLQKLRTGKQWARLRKMFLADNPLCADPFGVHAAEGVITPAQEVHHVKPAGDNRHLFYAPNNLASLCRMCHNRIEDRSLIEQLQLLGRLDGYQ